MTKKICNNNIENTNNAVALLPWGKHLVNKPWNISVDEMNWPLGLPYRLKDKKLSEFSHNDHLIIYPSKRSLLYPYFGTRANISVRIYEPLVIHGRYIKWLKLTHWRFYAILTVYENLIDSISNTIHLPFGSTWVPNWENIELSKTDMISIIASEKDYHPGHILRHNLIRWMKENDIDGDAIGHGYKPFKNKWEGLAPYYFSVIIENSFEKSYFTEKLIDAILCETVPIYLGCPDIDNYLDTRGMIICKDIEDVKSAVLSVSKYLYYEKYPFLNSIKKNAAWYGEYDKRTAQAVLGHVHTS